MAARPKISENSFFKDFLIYVGRMREFTPVDWIVYFIWVGMMVGLLGSVSTFLAVGYFNGVVYPPYVWNIPLGILTFTIAIAIDTVGHRTVYYGELVKAEGLVHHITIFAGITSVLALCLAYTYPSFFRIPAITLIMLSFVFSFVDEAFHWIRYYTKKSDRVEMWSHFGILVGHGIMILAWWYWFDQGYPGVAETLVFL